MADQSTTNGMTATDVLRLQHEQVKFMFGQMEELTGDARRELFDCLRTTLAVHETAEEEVVHPRAKRISDAAQQAVQARLDEESEAKQVLSNLEKLGVDDGKFDELFTEFRSAVLRHAEAEESEIFPLLEANVDRQELEQMAEALLVAEEMAPTHPHPHGPESALGNLMVGPFVAVADKVRDKLAERHHASSGK